MRKIESEVFWNNAKEAWGEEKYNMNQALILAPGPYETIRDMEHCYEAEVYPTMLTAAQANGCRDQGAVLDHLKACMDIAVEVYQNRADWLLGTNEPPFEVKQQYRSRISDLNHVFSAQRKCHNSENYTVCYCDEKKA